MSLKRRVWVAALAAAALAFTACGGNTAAPSAPSSPTSAASSPAAPDPASPAGTTSPAVGTTCEDFQGAVTETTTNYQHLRMARGSDIEYESVLADLTTDMATFDALAPSCARKAVAALAALSEATAVAVAAYPPNSAGSDLTAGNDALDEMEQAGRAAWRKLGVATYGWDYVQQ